MKKRLRYVFGLLLVMILSISLLAGCGSGRKSDSGEKTAGNTQNSDAEEELEDLEIEDTAWEVDGDEYHFFDDGTMTIDGLYFGTYTWDGQTGEIEIDGTTAFIMQDEDGFFIEGEDNTFYGFSYVGNADYGLAQIETYYISGDYDNDEEDISVILYTDGTFTMSDLYESVEGEYTLYEDGDMFFETDSEIVRGTYDASDDTFVIEGLDGYFYCVTEAFYTPW